MYHRLCDAIEACGIVLRNKSMKGSNKIIKAKATYNYNINIKHQS
ncbi:MAG: hypothetical protein JWO03_80 [Bacteroidetes bacterium]|nr:hypothetical protein [Bacteroidota bacterium]